MVYVSFPRGASKMAKVVVVVLQVIHPCLSELRHPRADVVSCLPQCLHMTGPMRDEKRHSDRQNKTTAVHGQAQYLLPLQESPQHTCAIRPLATCQAF